MLLGEVLELVESVTEALSYSTTDDVDLPPEVELSDAIIKSQDTEPELVRLQFEDSLCWGVPLSDPDPGAVDAGALHHYHITSSPLT